MSADIDVVGSDNDIEVIVVTESPERSPASEEDDSVVSEINVEETDDEEDEIDIESVPLEEENQREQGIPLVGESPVAVYTPSSRTSGVIPLPPLPSLTFEVSTNAVTAVESIHNITIQSNAVTSVESVHNFSVQPYVATTDMSTASILSQSQILLPSESRSVSLEASASNSATRAPTTPSTSTKSSRSSNLVHGGLKDSPCDFRSPKRRRIMSPGKSGDGELEDEGNCCPICFEEWTSSGNHRLASLRCGHLFGQSCIDKWLKGQGGKCPQCNAKAKRQDIRVLYAKCLKVVDTTERDRALQELEKEKEARKRSEMEAAQMRMQYQLTVADANKLRNEITKLREQLQSVRSQSSIAPTSSQPTLLDNSMPKTADGQFVLDKTIKIWDGGNCRVMAYSPSLATLVVSQPSASPLFPGFGIKKISTLDFKTSQYLTIHSKTIRDVSFHPFVDDGILLSCALDKTVKMTSVISNAVVQTYETQLPSWSCVWNSDDRNFFYVGMQNGHVLEYDIRNTAEHVQELNTEGSRSPVASLQYVPNDMNAVFRCGGLLVGQLDKISFYEKKQDQYRLHMLPLEGSLSSQCFEPNTRHLLCSFKPSQKHATVRHQLCEMNYMNVSVDPTALDMSCSCDIIQTFHAGRTQTLLSKSILLPHPKMENNLYVCAGDESTQSLHIWESGSGQLKQRLRTDGAVLDICAIRTNQMTFLAALTDKILKVFKWC